MALAEVFERVAGPDAPVEFRAYDGSAAGTGGAPVRITVKTPTAVSYLAQAPGALGLARAYVSGHLDVDGDMYTALARMASAQRLETDAGRAAPAAQRPGRPEAAVAAGRRRRRRRSGSTGAGWLGRRHSKHRDASAISHHYDVSNTFYEWVLGPSMAYTCACYPTRGRDAGAGAGVPSSTWSPASSGCSRACGCWTSAAAGAAWSCTPPASTASRRWA